MITGTVLRDAVLGCIELNSDAVTVTRFKVWENINSAMIALLRIVPITVIDNVIKTRVCDLVNAASMYQFPTDYVRLNGIWLNYDNDLSLTSTRAYECILANWQFYGNSIYQYRYCKQHPKFMYIEGGFDIRPVPAAAQTNGYRIKYVYTPPTVSESQQCLLRTDLKDAIVFKAAQLCCLIDSYNIELSKVYEGLFDKEVMKLSVGGRE